MKIIDLRNKIPRHKTKAYKKRKAGDIRSLAIHHSLTLSGSAEAFARFHVQSNDWPGIGYAYVIDRDGIVYWCWDWTVVSYHVGNSNKHALGICLVGDFRTQKPTAEQYAASVELVEFLQRSLPNATKVLGHSEYPEYSWKSCPVISMPAFRSAINKNNEEDQPMTASEKAAFEELQKVVKKQAERIEVLEKRTKAPAWFVEEFGSSNLKGLISEPQFTHEGWRTLAVSLRAQKKFA